MLIYPAAGTGQAGEYSPSVRHLPIEQFLNEEGVRSLNLAFSQLLDTTEKKRMR
ncbi:MAG TPA: hypothetical protein V6D50_20100 [Chroococcales cyanobacterium]